MLLVLAALPLWSSARSLTPSTSVNIVNSSNWEIRHVYLQASDQDVWSTDQLGGTVIAPGASFTLNTTCDGTSTKVITEDKDGCFLNTTISCDGTTTWTITNNLTPDCD
jgi:CCR4-NOT transcriptional regulation complex NOT5 subunit